MSTGTPFQISIPDDALGLLQDKLEQVRLPDELDGAGWEYGVPLEDMRRLVARWANGYDWRKAEAELNALPMFTRDIDVEGFWPLNIHYVHQTSDIPSAIPLLFVHGWPGSFIEARKILPLLAQAPADQPSFNVVAISLPNFGFSAGVQGKGFALHQYAEVGHKLMLALGYEEYVVQGGDWGHLIANTIANDYGPTHVKAWHTNMPKTQSPASPILNRLKLILFPYSDDDVTRMTRTAWWQKQGGGYFALQTTQPQTLGYALADSPVALLAWIYEKLVTWTDAYAWDDDEVLTWVSIYWFSRAGPAASLRIYFEVMKAQQFDNNPRPKKVPLGITYFPKEIISSPVRWGQKIGHVVFQSEHPKGGHFAAYEQPVELVGDLRKMFGRDGPAFGAVAGRNGYVK